MNRTRIINILRDYKASHAEHYKIQALGFFGSAVRDDFRDDSDIDVVLRISEPDLFKLAGIKDDLEKRFRCQVDLVTYRDSMNSLLKQRIDSEAVYV